MGAGDHWPRSGMAPSFRSVAATAALVAGTAGGAQGESPKSCVDKVQVSLCSTVVESAACNTSFTYYGNITWATLTNYPNITTGNYYYAPCEWNSTAASPSCEPTNLLGLSYVLSDSPLISVQKQCCRDPSVPMCFAATGEDCTGTPSKSEPNNGCAQVTNQNQQACVAISPDACGFVPCTEDAGTCQYRVPPPVGGITGVIKTAILAEASSLIGPEGARIHGTVVTQNDLANLKVSSYLITNEQEFINGLIPDFDISLSFGAITNACVQEALVSVINNATQIVHATKRVEIENCKNINCTSIDACPSDGGSAASSGRGRRSTASSAKITVRQNSGLSGGAIAGVVIGSLAGATLVGVAVWQKWFRKEGGKVLSKGRMYTFL